MRQFINLSFGAGPLESPGLLKLVVRSMMVMLAAICLTLFVPGLIAANDHVFFDAGVRAKLPAPAVSRLSGYEDQKRRLNESVEILRQNLDSLDDVSQQKEFDFYIHLLEERRQEAAALQPPIFTIGFFLGPQMLLWPAIYASLGCLLFCFQKSTHRLSGWTKKFRLLPLGMFVYIYYEWPMWARNFLLGSHGRTVYAYTNYDIDPSSFLTQECMIAGFAFLIAAVWFRWSDLAADQEDDNEINSEVSYLNAQFIFSIQRTFYRWIASSFVLGLGFIYFTTFFWSLVAKYHDERYIVSAFLAHSLWALTWMFISVPLMKSWNCLKAKRLSAIEQVMKVNESAPGKNEQLNLEALEKFESLAGLRISIAGAGAVVSLVLPIVQLFFHKG